MSLASQAVLVRLSVELFQQATTDKAVTQEVNDHKKAARKAGRYVKQLFTPEALEGLVRVVTQARSLLRRDTVPWDMSGVHLLALKKWETFNAEMFRLEQEFAEQRESFIENYPNHIAATREKLGDLFNEEDYPTTDDLRFPCVFKVDYLPVPQTSDIRVLDSELQEKISGAITRSYGAVIDHLAGSLYDEVKAVHDQLEQGERFRVERIERLRESVERVKEYNLTGDPRVDEALEMVSTQVIARLDAYVAERESRTRDAKNRAEVAQEEAKAACYKTALDLAELFS